MMHIRHRSTAALFAVGAILVLGAASCACAATLEGFGRSPLEVRSKQGRQWFNIYIADTPERQMRGLMFVSELPADEGMLFPQDTPRTMTMWMKNTLIPLDMLFIDTRGRVVCLLQRTVPQSLELLTCDQSVKAVLEIGGGQAEHRGIAKGDVVVHRLFKSH
jgi:uncharacterized protein